VLPVVPTTMPPLSLLDALPIYAAVAELYESHVGESVEPWVREKLATKPIPWASSFLELGIAQWLYDRGGFWQLREYEESSWAPRSEERRVGKEGRLGGWA